MANPFDRFDNEESGNPFDQFDAAPTSKRRVTGNMNPTAAETRKFQKEALQREGTIRTRIRNTSPLDMAKNAALEVPRFAEEVITTPLSLAKKSAYGLGSLATMGASLAKGGTVDESLRAGSQVMEGYKPIEGPLAPSMTGTLIGTGIEKGITAAENATGNTGFAGAGIQAAADITGLVGGGVILGKVGKAGKTALRDLADNTRLGGIEAEVLGLADLRPNPKQPKLDTIINKGVDKGIRPGVAGNRTFKQSEGYHRKAQEAVKTIVENKDALKLTDEYGEATQGLPKNLRQFSQSIDQTKSTIFKQYDEMAKAAGETGAKVDLGGIPAELLKVANNKSLQLAAPDAAAYAQKRAAAFQNVNAATDGVTTTRNNFLAAEQAQEVITMFNQSLESFYKNPSYDTASKAYIDSLIVNNLRKELDGVIEKTSGPGYQQLKNQYGALKSIEKDVAQRAIVDARRNVKGLLDFSDVFSGSQVVGGLMSMNPATVSSGVAAKIIANLYKIKNDPNKIIENMFRQVDKRYKPTPRAAFTPPAAAARAAEVNPMEGKVNTLNLPTGPQRVKDPSSGRMIETAQRPMAANTGGIVQPGPVVQGQHLQGRVNTGGIVQPGPTVQGQYMAGRVNTGGIVQPGPVVQGQHLQGKVNTGGIVQPGPVVQGQHLAGRVNTGGIVQPSSGMVLDPSTGRMISRKQPDMPVNTGNLGRETQQPQPKQPAPAKGTPKTWREFLSANMGAAMKSEGGHAGAIRKLAKEWNELKK